MTFTVSVDGGGTLYPPESDNVSLQIIELTVETSRFDEAGLIEMKALADATPEELRDILVRETGISVTVNDTRIGSGMLNDLSVDGEGVLEITAVDGIRNLYRNEVGEEFRATDVFTVIDRVFEAAGIEEVHNPSEWLEGQPGYYIHVDPSNYRPVPGEPSVDPGDTEGEGGATSVNRNFNDTGCIEAVNKLTEEYRWTWRVDRNNILHIVDELSVSIFDIEYILETTAGIQSPPYRRVVVYGGTSGQSPPEGDGSTAEGTRRHLMSRAPVKGEAGEGEPVFEYTDKSLESEAKASRVAQGIKREFERQQRSGEVTIIGNPEISPLDAIYVPDDMGGEGYAVSSIKHTVNGEDGFTTMIGVGGLLDEDLNQ